MARTKMLLLLPTPLHPTFPLLLSRKKCFPQGLLRRYSGPFSLLGVFPTLFQSGCAYFENKHIGRAPRHSAYFKNILRGFLWGKHSKEENSSFLLAVSSAAVPPARDLSCLLCAGTLKGRHFSSHGGGAKCP